MLIKNLIFLLSFFSIHALAQSNHQRLSAIPELKNFTFGSCNNHHAHQYVWDPLLKEETQLWIWGGDNVYADWNKSTDNIAQSYATQNAHPGYQQFKAMVPMIGTWDDHDYGYDEANGHFRAKRESQQLFLDFIQEPADSKRRAQEGIQTSYEFGRGEKKVKFIILDNRYFKDLEPDAPILGNAQWAWLEEELKNSDAGIHFIVGGLSFLSPIMRYTEQWADYGWEYQRLMELLDKYKPKGLVLLSGDKHFASIWKRNGHLEMMSSGLTHVAPRVTWWYIGRRYPIAYFGVNYGRVDIEWEGSKPLITTSIKNWSGRNIFTKNFAWEGGTWVEKWKVQIGADQMMEETEDFEERAPRELDVR